MNMLPPTRFALSAVLAPRTCHATGPWAVWLGTLSLAGLCGGVQAQSLQTLYEAARGYDATFLAARAQYEASVAQAAQAQAGLLPNVGLSADAMANQRASNVNTQDGSFNTQNLQLTGRQPLYRPANRLTNEQAQHAVQAAQARLQAAQQDVLVRTAQAYFDVLAAQDSLTFVQAQKTAVTEQLAAAQRSFEVGSATITDTREAQARFDLVLAQEIAADNDVRVKKLALDQLVGRNDTAPWRLQTHATLPPVEPGHVQHWVTLAETEHPTVRQAALGLSIAQLETRKAQTGHQPTLDAVAQYQLARTPSSSSGNASYVRNQTTSVGVQFNLPVFAGHAVQNRVKETLALEDKARNDWEAAKRSVAQATRASYFGVVSGLGQVKALQAAEASSQSALEANQLGYQVGVRINIDVLNAQSQLYQTKAQLAQARYNVLLGGLKLKQASGVLQDSDLQPINAVLVP